MFTSVIYPCQSVLAQERKLESILSTGQEISEMCSEYDTDNTEASDDGDKTVYTRLIVKTDNPIDEYGAVDSVYGFGYAFLQ